ncbi:MAG: LCP family protein [Actinomycetia bacterium]|nr:LCP family protein [Actinomycetes bacterium]
MHPMDPYDEADVPTRFKPHHTGAQRAVMAFNIVVVIACLVGAGALLYGKNELDNTLATQQVDVVTTTAVPAPTTTVVGTTIPVPSTTPATFPPIDPAAKNFLIAGSDANSCVDPGSPWANAADPGRDAQGRSDSIMIMRIDPATRAAAVLSFPRDLWVKINGANGRINTAYVQDDYTLLAQTVYDNFGIVIDHYLQVDFCAFKLIVDAVGGVAVPFKTPIIDAHVGLYIGAGCHVFSGDEALAYVRSRHLKWIDAAGNQNEDRAADLGRISRQQDFLRRVLQAAVNKGIYNPAVATALIESMQTYVVRDSGLLAIDQILQFAGVMRDINPTTIRTYQVESYGKVVGGVAVQVPKLTTDNMLAILAIFQGTAPLAGVPAAPTTTTTTIAGSPTPATVATTPATTVATGGTVVVEPDEDVQGDIVPDETVQC